MNWREWQHIQSKKKMDYGINMTSVDAKFMPLIVGPLFQMGRQNLIIFLFKNNSFMFSKLFWFFNIKNNFLKIKIYISEFWKYWYSKIHENKKR
jgi:hypothetical protein